MGAVANSGHLSTLSSTAANGLTDKVDSPHSGLFKAIHTMSQGNYAVKDNASAIGFVHTIAGGGSPNVEVTAGKAFFDGKYVAVDALPSSPVTLTKPSSGAFYHWIVAQDDGDGTYSCAIVAGSVDGVVPDLNTTARTVEKIPISLIKVQSTDTDSTVAIQYFTTSKEQNSLSIGYSDANVYTEAGSITGSANGLLYSSGLTTAGAILTMATNEPSVVNNDVLGRINFQAPLDTGLDSDLVGASIAAVAQDTFSDTVNSTALIFQTGKSETATTKMTIDEDGAVTLAAIAACGSDTDKFLVSDSGVIKFRTGAEVRSDIGAGTSSVTLSGSSDDTIATVTGANALAGEANLTFDTTTLAVTGNQTITPANDVGAAALTITNADTDQIALDINAANIDADVLDITANALTTGKAINLTTSSVPADAGTSIVNSFVMANTSTNSQTAKGLFFDFNKTGITASGKTANVTGMQIDIDDSVTNVGTVNITGLDIDVDFGNAGGTVKTVGLDVAVGAGGTAADTTYAALFSGGNVGIGTATPMNILQVNHTGADTDDGVLIVRDDASTADGDLLGGMGFDSADGNIPSTVTEASAFIASYATEDHAATDKGGNLKLGVSLIDEDDDVVSTVLATVGPPDTTTAAAGAAPAVYAGFHSRATVVDVGDATYSPALTCSGTIILMSHADTIITLPDVGAADIGVQFTIINMGDTIEGQIVSADTSNTRFNNVPQGMAALSYAAQDIGAGQKITYLCTAADTWYVLAGPTAEEEEPEEP